MIHTLSFFLFCFFSTLSGVRISAFVSSEDKKPLQKSIIGFLQHGKTGPLDSIPISQKHEDDCVRNHCVQTRPLACLEPVQTAQKADEALLWRKQKGSKAKKSDEEPQLSFFQRAHAQRLKLQAINASRPVADASAEPPADHQEADSAAADLPEDHRRPPHDEAIASTSGCGSKVLESLHCPVCFRSVETNDLNVFNRHIDQCLSDASKNQSESDLDQENYYCKEELGEVVAEVSEPTGGNHKEEPPTLTDASHTSALLIKEGDGTSKNLQTSDSKVHVLICPICQLSQNNDDLIMFNQHVDLCLNQEALSKLEGETPSVTSNASFGKCAFSGRACLIFFETRCRLTFSSRAGQG